MATKVFLFAPADPTGATHRQLEDAGCALTLGKAGWHTPRGDNEERMYFLFQGKFDEKKFDAGFAQVAKDHSSVKLHGQGRATVLQAQGDLFLSLIDRSTFVIAPVYSSDGGVTFTQGGGGQAWVTSLGTATWVTAAGVGSAFMSAGATYRFGISVQGVLGTTGLSNVSCGISSDIRPRDIDD